MKLKINFFETGTIFLFGGGGEGGLEIPFTFLCPPSPSEFFLCLLVLLIFFLSFIEEINSPFILYVKFSIYVNVYLYYNVLWGEMKYFFTFIKILKKNIVLHFCFIKTKFPKRNCFLLRRHHNMYENKLFVG